MYKSTLRSSVALIIILGHFLIFGFGFILGVFNNPVGSDTVHIILMASPVLAVTAIAAFSSLLENATTKRKGRRINYIPSFLMLAIPTFLLISIGTAFYQHYDYAGGFGPDELKTSLGAIETFFGAFIGGISKFLFEIE